MSNFQASFQLADNIDQDKIFLVNLSDIEGRIDPSPYKSAFSFQSKIFPSFKLNKIAFINPTTAFPIDQDAIYSFIPMDAVSDKNGNIEYILEKPITEIKGFTKFKSGDLIWAKITPCMQNGKSAVVKETTEYVCGSTEFHVIRPRNDELNIEYIHFILRDTRILEAAKNFFGGSAGQQRVSDIFLKTLNIPLPPKHIQNKFVELWNETKRLSIEKKLEAQNLLDSINDYLLTELDIKVPDIDNSLSNRMFTVQASELSGGRFDAYRNKVYFQELQKVLENHTNGSVPLKKYTKNMASGQWGVDEEDGYDRDIYTKCLVIRATEFDNNGNLSFDENRIKYRLIENNKLKKMNILEHDLLIEKSGGSENQPVGRIAILTKNILNDYGNIAYSNFVQKITVNSTAISPVFLFYYLKTLHNIKFTEKMQSQTNGIRNLITSEYLDTPIINVDCQKQHEIVQHIDKVRATATQLQQEANEILAQAKQKIERMILGEEN